MSKEQTNFKFPQKLARNKLSMLNLGHCGAKINRIFETLRLTDHLHHFFVSKLHSFVVKKKKWGMFLH